MSIEVRYCLLSLLLLCVFVSDINAATYYVRTDGNDSKTGTSNTSDVAWLTVDHAADNVSAGDVVRIQSGTYSELITPGVNGTGVDSTITFVADGNVTVCGMDLSSNSYLRFVGIIFDGDVCEQRRYVVDVSGTNHHLEFWNNTIRDGEQSGFVTNWSKVEGLASYVNNSIFIGNTWSHFGYGTQEGNGNIIYAQGNNNLYAYNDFSNSYPDVSSVEGTHRNRWLNNYIHDMVSSRGAHSDIWQAGSSNRGWSYNLYEANFQSGSGLSDEHTTQFSHTQASTRCEDGVTCGEMTNNVFRRNVWHNIGSGTIGVNQTSDGNITNIRYYNNTLADACVYGTDNVYSGVILYSSANYPEDGFYPGGYFYNNIDYEGWSDSVSTYIDSISVEFPGTDIKDYNLAYDPDGTVSFNTSWTDQGHEQSNIDPGFIDFDNDDFHISAVSGAVGNGGPLTSVASDNGTGTTFNVAANTGAFFIGDNSDNITQYSGSLVPGDTITVGTDILTVASVSGDSITVTSSFTWATGDPVYYGGSAAIDIGAYPYMASGYSLSGTYIKAGSTVTITPSSSDLVRFVVCYEDGIPIDISISSPYTCDVGSGILSVKMYSKFANTATSTTATEYVVHNSLKGRSTATLGGSFK